MPSLCSWPLCVLTHGLSDLVLFQFTLLSPYPSQNAAKPCLAGMLRTALRVSALSPTKKTSCREGHTPAQKQLSLQVSVLTLLWGGLSALYTVPSTGKVAASNTGHTGRLLFPQNSPDMSFTGIRSEYILTLVPGFLEETAGAGSCPAWCA